MKMMASRFVRVWDQCGKFYWNRRTVLNRGATMRFTIRPFASYDSDPAPFFLNPEVQLLLKKLTKKDTKQIFRNKMLGERADPPSYKFLTTQELQKYLDEAEEKADEFLQIPPIVKEREEINEVVSTDPALKGLDDSKYVFTDITYGISDKDRLIVIREPGGVLRKARWDERFRINQIYFPRPDRQLRMPHMFEEQHLMELLKRGEYLFVLDRACNQFEPYDHEYHRVTSTTYDHVEKEQKFEVLQSTRHFGALTFYLCWHKRIDKFILYYIQNELLNDAVSLIKLFHLLHPEALSSRANSQETIKFVQAYIECDSERKGVLELALQSYLELEKQRDHVEKGIQKAHGL